MDANPHNMSIVSSNERLFHFIPGVAPEAPTPLRFELNGSKQQWHHQAVTATWLSSERLHSPLVTTGGKLQFMQLVEAFLADCMPSIYLALKCKVKCMFIIAEWQLAIVSSFSLSAFGDEAARLGRELSRG